MREKGRPSAERARSFERPHAASPHEEATPAVGPRTPVEALARLWWIWFAAYFGLGIYAQQNGETSLLAGTVDRIDSMWIAIVFLNLPLQMMLAFTALLLDRTSHRTTKRLAIGLAVLLTLLVLVHLVLSFVTSIGVESLR